MLRRQGRLRHRQGPHLRPNERRRNDPRQTTEMRHQLVQGAVINHCGGYRSRERDKDWHRTHALAQRYQAWSTWANKAPACYREKDLTEGSGRPKMGR